LLVDGYVRLQIGAVDRLHGDSPSVERTAPSALGVDVVRRASRGAVAKRGGSVGGPSSAERAAVPKLIELPSPGRHAAAQHGSSTSLPEGQAEALRFATLQSAIIADPAQAGSIQQRHQSRVGDVSR
jgi:hypothetical protein